MSLKDMVTHILLMRVLGDSQPSIAPPLAPAKGASTSATCTRPYQVGCIYIVQGVVLGTTWDRYL
eukprot:173511-Amphidinium_carterae.1